MPQNRHPYLCLSFYLALQPGRDPKPLEHRFVENLTNVLAGVGISLAYVTPFSCGMKVGSRSLEGRSSMIGTHSTD